MHIRDASEDDLPQVLQVHREAFGGETEAGLVQAILADPGARPTVSLLAAEADRALGHVLFSRAGVADADKAAALAILAPLAIVPLAQGKGLGSRLVAAGLDRLAADGIAGALVLGDPAYYRRFGFRPARPRGLLPPYALPEAWAEAWMLKEFGNGSGAPCGTVTCCAALMKPELWQP